MLTQNKKIYIFIIAGLAVAAIIFLIALAGFIRFNFTNGGDIVPEKTVKDAILEKTGALTEAEAIVIAEKDCIKGGEALGPGSYNEVSKTWWFDANLNAAQAGCSPACVVSEETKTVEINWRCTGLIEP